VFAAASALVGLAAQNLVARMRNNADALAVREHDLEAIGDLSRSLSESTDARERICAAAHELSGAHFAVLLEGQGDGTLAWTAGAGLNLPSSTFTSTTAPAWAITAYRTRAALLIPGADGDPNANAAAFEAAQRPATVLFEPVHRGDETVGVLIVGWRQRPTDPRRTTGIVRLLASEAAFVIERADLLRRLTAMALTDELTGLPNRRAWDERFEQAVRDAEPVCVAILDLDDFKSFNDGRGHQAGDQLLKEAAAAWGAQLRPTDTLARYGGDEFVVLLRDLDLRSARGVVERLRAATPRGQSCSAGIAGREDGEMAAVLLGRADQALYEAKRAGRNRSLLANQ
jgi:diguanylate cyclase (GGDEF)-like protein